jgi:carbon-monoxide dehydrogenase medium subunit
MNSFELVEPSSLKEAVALLDPDDPSVRPLSGGTALMLMMKAAVFQPSRLVSLQRVEAACRAITRTASGELCIGALASLSEIEHSADVRRHAPTICRAMSTLSNVRVRNVARIGGNLAHGDPHMDMPPLLSALGGRVSVISASGAREIALEDFFVGYYQTKLEPGELIRSVVIPDQRGRCAAYIKLTSRSADDWPALGVAVSLAGHKTNVREARIFVSAATEKPTRVSAAEQALSGEVSDRMLREAGEAAAAEVEIMGDSHGSAAYKRELLRVCVGRAVRRALSDRAEG